MGAKSMPSHPDRVRRNYEQAPEPELKFAGFPVVVRDDCPPHSIYFMPEGSRTADLATGKVLMLQPGYYVNPRALGVITNVK